MVNGKQIVSDFRSWRTGKVVAMNSIPETWKKTEGLAKPVGESPKRWIIDCIACDTPVEPWQTEGYQFGYCKSCFETLMDPDTMV
jgi:hypothetical protein